MADTLDELRKGDKPVGGVLCRALAAMKQKLRCTELSLFHETTLGSAVQVKDCGFSVPLQTGPRSGFVQTGLVAPETSKYAARVCAKGNFQVLFLGLGSLSYLFEVAASEVLMTRVHVAGI